MNVELVEQRDVKMVVVACNTAAAAALHSLQESFDVPVVGVIEPDGKRGASGVTSRSLRGSSFRGSKSCTTSGG
jgi:glutamate racemase